MSRCVALRHSFAHNSVGLEVVGLKKQKSLQIIQAAAGLNGTSLACTEQWESGEAVTFKKLCKHKSLFSM